MHNNTVGIYILYAGTNEKEHALNIWLRLPFNAMEIGVGLRECVL